jgi:lipoprotein-anchoring transpeptidase ErfK/SrfK
MCRLAPIVLAGLLAVLVMSCRSSSSGQSGLVTIEPLASATATIILGGKPAAPPTSVVAAATADPIRSDAPLRSAAVGSATPAAEPRRPTEASLQADGGRWIEVDVTKFVVRLMDGSSVVREIAPVAVGAQVDTGEYASTQTGLFHVYSKAQDLAYDAPYDTYISHWVGFDPDKANGFHSFLKGKDGTVVDASTGRVSNGCIRTGAEDAIYAFAEIGMPVWVHI